MVAQPKPRKPTATEPANSERKPVRTFGDFAPVLIHDFKGPLSAIALNLDFVLEQLPRDSSMDSLRGALWECRQAGERIFRVIANLLDVARCEEGRLSLRIAPANLSELVAAVMAEHEEETLARSIDFRVRVPENLPLLETDVDLLARVLHNLVDNALRSVKNGGVVILTGICVPGEHGTELEIRIANDGPPIPTTIRPRLFQRHLGSEYNGAGANRGVGLYFCRLVLAELGASIALLEGSEFPVCFVIRHPIQLNALHLHSSDYPNSSTVPI